MKLKDIAKNIYNETDKNCAESIIYAFMEYYDYPLSDETVKAISALGDGLQSGFSTCGAINGGVAIIGLLTNKKNKAMRNNRIGCELTDDLVMEFIDQFDNYVCVELNAKQGEANSDNCIDYVDFVASYLENCIKEHDLLKK